MTAHIPPAIRLTRDCRRSKICRATVYEIFRLVGCHADFEGPFFPLSRREREKAQPASSITCIVMEY